MNKLVSSLFKLARKDKEDKELTSGGPSRLNTLRIAGPLPSGNALNRRAGQFKRGFDYGKKVF